MTAAGLQEQPPRPGLRLDRPYDANVRRVLVIGCPGSGKSTIAADLARILRLSVIHLDALYHDPENRYTDNKTAWRRQVVDDLTQRDSWIMDGHYPATLDARLRAADTVVYLDFATCTCLMRAIRRRFRTTSGRHDIPPGWRERLSPSLIFTILLFQRTEAPRVRRLLHSAAADSTVVILRNSREVRTYVQTLSSTR